MFFSSQLVLILIVLFQGGPGGGGPGGGGQPQLEPCTCLMVDGVQTCQQFGPWPGANPPRINCGVNLCGATLPLPSCTMPPPNKTEESVNLNSWISEHVKYRVPKLGEVGWDRKPTGHYACVTEVKCHGCFEDLEADPPGNYCSTREIDIKKITLYGLCTDAQMCYGVDP